MSGQDRPSRRMSEWYLVARREDPTTQRCGTCKGTGLDPAYISLAPYKTCPACRGFGY